MSSQLADRDNVDLAAVVGLVSVNEDVGAILVVEIKDSISFTSSASSHFLLSGIFVSIIHVS